MLLRFASCFVVLLVAGLCLAQSSEPTKPAWFTQGYHLAGPVSPSKLRPVDVW